MCSILCFSQAAWRTTPPTCSSALANPQQGISPEYCSVVTHMYGREEVKMEIYRWNNEGVLSQAILH